MGPRRQEQKAASKVPSCCSFKCTVTSTSDIEYHKFTLPFSPFEMWIRASSSLLGLELADQVIVRIRSVVCDHFQYFARALQHDRKNPLMKEFLRFLGMILYERLDLRMFEIQADT